MEESMSATDRPQEYNVSKYHLMSETKPVVPQGENSAEYWKEQAEVLKKKTEALDKELKDRGIAYLKELKDREERLKAVVEVFSKPPELSKTVEEEMRNKAKKEAQEAQAVEVRRKDPAKMFGNQMQS
mgnify:CR=1 FL=1